MPPCRVPSGGTQADTTAALVARLRSTLGERGGADEVLRHEQVLPAQPPAFGVLRPHLPRPLAHALRAGGVSQLYAHQVAAIEHVRARRNVVLTSPTASGKSLAFSVPTLERLLETPGRHALYVYPTKALIADQLRALATLLARLDVPDPPRAAMLTGDTPADQRRALLADPPAILLVTPDILHASLLPGHGRWRRFLAGLETVVLDELHSYRGVFGAHVALVLRRLRRLAGLYGATPTFIGASATIGNPVELAEQLLGLPFVGVSGDAAGVGARRFLFWRPPLRGAAEANEHASVLEEAAGIFAEALRSGRSGILFGRARVSVERMLLDVRGMVGSDLAPRVSAYKAGYTPAERAQVEADLRAGRLVGVVATNALELGIDVGALDVAVLAGYPGSAMSFWQQAGRVGRRADREALIVLVGGDDALDQYYLDHPEGLFGASMEQAVVDPSNPAILLGHLLCASRERPLTDDDLALLPPNAPRLVRRLASEGLLSDGPPWRFELDAWPHAEVGLRGTARERYTIHGPARRVLGHAEQPYLYRECHPGAVYLHNGRAYRVTALDDAAHVVRVEDESPTRRTEPLAEVAVEPKGEPAGTRELLLGEHTVRATVGPLVVRERVVGYREHISGTGAITAPLERPLETVLETVGLWLDLPAGLESDRASLHALEHALVNALPLQLLCDRRNLGSTHEVGPDARPVWSLPLPAPGPDAPHPARVYLYDFCEGGIGLCEKAFHLLENLLDGATRVLADCPCADGCPNCVHLAGCGLANADLDKHGALALLRGHAVRLDRSLSRLDRDRPRPRRDPAEQRQVLRRLADEDLRERLSDHAKPRVLIGSLCELPGEGIVVVWDLAGDQARVQPLAGGPQRWVNQRLLQPLKS